MLLWIYNDITNLKESPRVIRSYVESRSEFTSVLIHHQNPNEWNARSLEVAKDYKFVQMENTFVVEMIEMYHH